jgi:hypothetical protein
LTNDVLRHSDVEGRCPHFGYTFAAKFRNRVWSSSVAVPAANFAEIAPSSSAGYMRLLRAAELLTMQAALKGE